MSVVNASRALARSCTGAKTRRNASRPAPCWFAGGRHWKDGGCDAPGGEPDPAPGLASRTEATFHHLLTKNLAIDISDQLDFPVHPGRKAADRSCQPGCMASSFLSKTGYIPARSPTPATLITTSAGLPPSTSRPPGASRQLYKEEWQRVVLPQ